MKKPIHPIFFFFIFSCSILQSASNQDSQNNLSTTQKIWENPKKIAVLATYAFNKQDTLITAQSNHIKLLKESLKNAQKTIKNLEEKNQDLIHQLTQSKNNEIHYKHLIKGREEYYNLSLKQIQFFVDAMHKNIQTKDLLEREYPTILSLLEKTKTEK